MKSIDRIQRLLRNQKSRFMYRRFPCIVDGLVTASTWSARRKIFLTKAQKILVDSSVVGHAVTHETAWIDTGEQLWGDTVPIKSGYAARIPVHSEVDQSDVTQSVRFLPGIASLARHGTLQLFDSWELGDEVLTQPIGRFSGYGYYDHHLFSGINFERFVDPDYRMRILSSWHQGPTLREQRHERLKSKNDPLFLELTSALGPNNTQDAWHITTAERNGCFCFLTMDFKLLRNLEAQKGSRVLKSLNTHVMSPEQFGREFGLIAISPRLFSYHGASFPVHSELNWESSRRRRPCNSTKQ